MGMGSCSIASAPTADPRRVGRQEHQHQRQMKSSLQGIAHEPSLEQARRGAREELPRAGVDIVSIPVSGDGPPYRPTAFLCSNRNTRRCWESPLHSPFLTAILGWAMGNPPAQGTQRGSSEGLRQWPRFARHHFDPVLISANSVAT